MEKLDPKTDGATTDIVEQNIEKLKSLFPDVFTEGKVDLDALRETLGDYIDDRQERYSFTWNGKSRARRIAQTPSTGTLRPCPEESVNWDTTQNLFIEGDNLEVLKLLQKSYHKKVKMIYIDPPYNTGKDFIYPDDFRDNIKNYLELTGQTDGEGRRLSTNAETSGRYHTDWLNMMYPRLKLARNLLRDDGVIFISIDDNEVANLRKLCDEVFGEENYLGTGGRVAKKSNNKGDYWAPNFDYLLTYAKSIVNAVPFFGGVNYDAYNQTESSGERKGEKYQLVRLYMSNIQNRNPEQRFWIECPDGSRVIPPGSTFPPERPVLGDGIWRWTKQKFDAERDKIVIKAVRSSNLLDQDGNPAKWNVYTKTYLKDVIENATAKPNSLVEDHINQIGTQELRQLDIPFDYPKPSTLVQYLLEIARTENDAITLDFFAGSCPTAHAVLNLNKEDGGNRKFIMVQLPEPCDDKSEAFKAGYKTIADIGKERIRRVIKKIEAEQNQKAKNAEGNLPGMADEVPELDLGFKVFKLDASNIKPWDADFENLETALFNAVENIKPDRSEADVLYELLLKYGLDLAVPIEERKIDGKLVYIIGAGALIVCLADKISLDVVEGIAALKEELKPEVMRVVFKDSGFADDVVKTNAVQILRQAGIEDVKSL